MKTQTSLTVPNRWTQSAQISSHLPAAQQRNPPKMSAIFGLLLLSSVVTYSAGDICTDAICEYNFDVHHERTMVVQNEESVFDVELDGSDLKIVANQYRTVDRFPDSIGDVVDADDFIMADGFPRTIIAINDAMPGPTIEVMEGAQVKQHHRPIAWESPCIY